MLAKIILITQQVLVNLFQQTSRFVHIIVVLLQDTTFVMFLLFYTLSLYALFWMKSGFVHSPPSTMMELYNLVSSVD